MSNTLVATLPKVEPKDAIAEYRAVAESLGYEPLALKMIELDAWLAKNNIPVYNTEQVSAFLREKAKFKNSEGKDGFYSVYWFPLGKANILTKEERAERGMASFFGEPTFRNETYNKLVPISVLNTAKKIKDAFPDIKCHVSDILHVPDPFLIVGYADSLEYNRVVEFWDEPGFRPIG